MSVHGFLEWLGQTRRSVALLESLYFWPQLESAHVLMVALFLGTAAFNDLRLLGWGLTRVPTAEITGQLLRITRWAFLVMVITGVLIFYSNPVHYWHNVFFRIKLLLLAVAGLNIALFHGRIHRSVSQWGHMALPPRPARVAGLVSLLAWAGIVVAGRLIAYNWFDCKVSTPPRLIAWAAGCHPGD
jgi:hypothetical protein